MTSPFNVFGFFRNKRKRKDTKDQESHKRMKGPDFTLTALPDEVLGSLIDFVTEEAQFVKSNSTDLVTSYKHEFFIRKDILNLALTIKRIYKLMKKTIANIDFFQSGWFRKQVAFQATLDCRFHHGTDRQYMNLYYTQNGRKVSEYSVIVSYNRFRRTVKVEVLRHMSFGQRWIVVSDRCMTDPFFRERAPVHVFELFDPMMHLVAPEVQIPPELLRVTGSGEPGRLEFSERSFQSDIMEVLRTLGV
jgi:hypothetical protein